MQNSNKELKNEIEDLKGSNQTLKSKDWSHQKALAQSRYDFQELSKNYNTMVDFYNSIPDELRKDLAAQHQQSQGKTRNRNKGLDMER